MSSRQSNAVEQASEKKKAELAPQNVQEKLALFASNHEALVGVAIAAAAFAGFAAIFWFTVFSGISSSADLLYNQF